MGRESSLVRGMVAETDACETATESLATHLKRLGHSPEARAARRFFLERGSPLHSGLREPGPRSRGTESVCTGVRLSHGAVTGPRLRPAPFQQQLRSQQSRGRLESSPCSSEGQTVKAE